MMVAVVLAWLLLELYEKTPSSSGKQKNVYYKTHARFRYGLLVAAVL